MSIIIKENISEKVQDLYDKIVFKNAMHQSFLYNAFAQLTEDDANLLNTYLEYCEKQGLTIEELANSYLVIVGDTIREQIYFLKHGSYRNKSFDDVASDVYFDDNYMSNYMYGLAITSFLWPNHAKMRHFFLETLPKDKKGNYLDIGPGHGYYIMRSIQETSFENFTGLDISETSIKMTKDIINFFCPEIKNKYNMICEDFLNSDLKDKSFDAVIMGEVLEHVEKPDAFMREIRRIAKDDAYVFVTTCINAPAIDHIYLFETTEEIEEMFNQCGFEIDKELIVPYEGKSLEETKKLKLSINVAYVLKPLK